MRLKTWAVNGAPSKVLLSAPSTNQLMPTMPGPYNFSAVGSGK